jgi:methylphosphotriester-DNA--protein-cysteine methyltransferase
MKTYKLLNAQGNYYESSTPGRLGGYRKKKIYGQLDCPSAVRWLEKGHYQKERVFFPDEETAIAAGYRPCGICMKSAYQQWKLAVARFKQKFIVR